MNFELVSKFKPTGDQPQAIKQIVEGLRQDIYQTLQGVTGSGKTFTMANVVKEVNRPLLLCHNKTRLNCLGNSNNSSQTMLLNFLFHITITINPKPTFLTLDSILRKIFL